MEPMLYDDKRQLEGIEAVEFYLNIPERYGKDCYFVMFSFNYDVTMLLKGLRQGRSKNWHYDRVWEICKRKDKDTGKVEKNSRRAYVCISPDNQNSFAFSGWSGSRQFRTLHRLMSPIRTVRTVS